MLHALVTNDTRNRPALLPILLLIVLMFMVSTAAAYEVSTKSEADDQSPPSVTQSTSQSVWIISTRNAPRCNRQSVIEATLDYLRMDIDEDGCRRWLPADENEFHASGQSGIPTCFHIHGNRTSHCDAISEGLGTLKCLENQSHGQQFRMVIWSWPTERIRGRNRKDVRVKAARSDVQAYYLARCTQRLNPQSRVGMIGYSFGARVITGALEMLAGNSIAGYILDPQAEEETTEEPSQAALDNLPKMRIVLVASATDRCWFLPGRRNGSSLDMVKWALITRNSRDPILRWYPRMYGRRGPQAIGLAGPVLTCEQREKTEVVNLSCSVGKSHEWQRYLCSSRLYWRLGECVFVDDSSTVENASVESVTDQE